MQAVSDHGHARKTEDPARRRHNLAFVVDPESPEPPYKPRTRKIVLALGLPCGRKLPDSSFFIGVEEAASKLQPTAHMKHCWSRSRRVIAQECLPSEFDWRVGGT